MSRSYHRIVGLLPETVSALSSLGKPVLRKGFAAFIYLTLANLVEGMAVALLLPTLQIMASPSPAGLVVAPFGHWWRSGRPIALPIGLVLIIIVLMTFVRGWLARQRDVSSTVFSYALATHLRADLFLGISRAKWECVSTLRVSDLLNTISTDVVRAQVVAGQVLLLANDTLMLAIYIYLSFNLSPGLTLVAAAAGAAVLVGSFPLRRRAHRFGIAVGIQNQSQVRVLTDFLGGIKAAKCLGAEGAFVEEFNAAIFETQSIFLAYGRMRANASAFGQSGGVAVLALLAFLAKTMLNLSFASFGGFVIVMLRLVPRISGIQGSVQEILSNVSAFATIEELRKQLVAAAEPARSNRGAPLPLSTIALEGVSFAYGSATDHLALKEINLLLPVGSATALIGRSGSGKSTTADVLAALIWPTSGRVLLDDVALDATTGPAWRTRVAYVSQEGLLLNRTIAENLALGRVDIPTRELMWAALRSAGAEEFVLQLAQGLDSPVGERGLKLSGGERQRILLARALLGEPTLLILDEATSALDWRNQQNVAEAIRRLKGKTTVVIIAHSMPLVAVADQIVELSEGRVVARGDFVAVAAHPESVLNAMNPQ